MFARRNAAMLLVDCEMALRSGAWTPTRSASPHAAMATIGTLLASPASDDAIVDAADRLYAILGDAMAAGEAVIPGYEQLELGDVTQALFVEAAPVAANDTAPLAMAA